MRIQVSAAFQASAVIVAVGLAIGPAAAQTPAAAMALPKRVHARYSCHNLRVPVTYDNVKDRALVTYGSHLYSLPHVMSADGGRYMNDKLQWWDKGTSATLYSVTDGKADSLLATCERIPAK